MSRRTEILIPLVGQHLRPPLMEHLARAMPRFMHRMSEAVFDIPISAEIRRQKFLFIHVPRNAGTSISKTIYGSTIAHRSAQFYLDSDPQWFRSQQSVAVIRNPWDRLRSAYAFALAGGSSLVKVAPVVHDTVKKYSFNDFVLHQLGARHSLANMDPMFRPQHKFVCNRNGAVIVSRLFRFEAIGELSLWLDAQSIPHKGLPKFNSSDKDIIEGYNEMPDAVRRIVMKKYFRDFELFKYDPDSYRDFGDREPLGA